MPVFKNQSVRELIAQVDYSDTWTANSPTRSGSYLLLQDPVALQVERCHGNPPRSWVFSRPTAMTTWPRDNSPIPWPGFQVRGSRSGFTETQTGFDGVCYFGFEYGLCDDFVVQFDAVQTEDRIDVTVGDKPATIGDQPGDVGNSSQLLSVFFRVSKTPSYPEIGVYTPSKGEAETGLRSGIPAVLQWHNYAVRFNLREKRLGVWVDRQYRGAIDLARITKGMQSGGTWASLPWTNRYVNVGGFTNRSEGRVWTDNFCVGSPRETAMPTTAEQPTTPLSPTE